MRTHPNRRGRAITMSRLLTVLISCLVAAIIIVITVLFMITYTKSLYQTSAMNCEQAVSRVASTVEIYTEDMKKDLKTAVGEIGRCGSWPAIKETLQTVAKMRSNVVSIIIYDEEGNILGMGVNGQKRKEDYDPAGNLSFVPQIFEANHEFSITPPHVQNLFVNYYPWVVTVACKCRPAYIAEDVYITMDIRFSSIASYVDNVGIGPHGYCFVMDSRGNLVYHPQQQLIFAGLKAEDTEKIRSMPDGVSVTGEYLYAVKTPDNGIWKVAGVSYTDEIIQNNINSVFRVVVILLISCMGAGILASWLLSKRVSGPVRKLVKAMDSFEKDVAHFTYNPVQGIEEVQMLSRSFAHMVDMIKKLMEEIKEEEITLRKTELKALQTQINPHFLYNTLDSIQWMCEGGRAEEAVQMISALARLFRISISKGKELIPIESELAHAESYLVIQSFRYKNQFHYEFQVDETILSYLCNKITLQPIIENAIGHGIDRMVDEGIIIITAGQDGDDIVFTVSDNGVGMTREQCENILKKEGSDQGGIGIKNVNDRIRIYFGEGYGIRVESEPDVGTKVVIRFPKIAKEEEYEEKYQVR